MVRSNNNQQPMSSSNPGDCPPFFANFSKTPKINYLHQTLQLKERMDRNLKSQCFEYYDFDKDSVASTHDSNHRTKLSNFSYSDSNILKHQKYREYNDKAYDRQKELHQKLKSTRPDHLTESLKKAPSRLETNTPRERYPIQIYSQSCLRDSRQWDFSKKISRKNSDRSRVQESGHGRLEEVGQKDPVRKHPSFRHSRDFSYINPNQTSSYDRLQRDDKALMYLQRKHSDGENCRRIVRKTSRSGKYVTIEDFELGKSLGKGMYGYVYFAKLKTNGTVYALKKISKQIVKKNNMQAQLALQIKLQTFLNHPNILKLYHFFDDSKYIYLVMEYMEEGSLFDYMQRRHQRLSEKETAQIIIEMAHALTYLHDLDIVHRDIKPENIVISNGVRKLCDFGWATVCINRRSTYCGTFDYAAPQILEGKDYDGSVDLWCLGVLTYELIIRKMPFYDPSRHESIRKIINSDKEGVEFPTSVSTKCRHFIESLMRKRPQERLTAQDLYSHPYLALYLPKQRFLH